MVKTQDMRDAVLYEPGWTGGLAYPEYNIVIIGIAPADVEWGKRTEAHELTHVLVGDFTFSCLGSMPTWMVEGIAVYGEGGPEPSGVTYFEQNKKDNTLLSFKVLSGGFSEDPNQADLSYSQSYYMVNYLIEKYGKDKLIGFLKLLKTGGELNESLKSSYGFDLTGFENEWRSSLSLPIVEVNSVQATATPTIIPTIIPIEGMQPASTTTPRPVSPTTIVEKTPVSSDSPDIQNFLQSNTVKSILMIFLGGTCVFGILLIAGITILLVRNRKTNEPERRLAMKKVIIFSLIFICLFLLASILPLHKNVNAATATPPAYPPFPTATVYAPSSGASDVFVNEESGFSIKIPKNVNATNSLPDSGNFQEYEFGNGEIFGYLYPANMQAGDTLQEVGERNRDSWTDGLGTTEFYNQRANHSFQWNKSLV